MIIKKPKLNQTKMKLKQEIKIKVIQTDMDLLVFRKTKSIKKTDPVLACLLPSMHISSLEIAGEE